MLFIDVDSTFWHLAVSVVTPAVQVAALGVGQDVRPTAISESYDWLKIMKDSVKLQFFSILEILDGFKRKRENIEKKNENWKYNKNKKEKKNKKKERKKKRKNHLRAVVIFQLHIKNRMLLNYWSFQIKLFVLQSFWSATLLQSASTFLG